MGAVSVSRVRVAIESTARVGCAVAASLVREIERLDPMIVRERLDAWRRSPGVNPKHVPGLGTVAAVLFRIAYKHHTHKVGESGVGYFDETNEQACGKLWIDESTYKACLRFLEWTGALQTLARPPSIAERNVVCIPNTSTRNAHRHALGVGIGVGRRHRPKPHNGLRGEHLTPPRVIPTLQVRKTSPLTARRHCVSTTLP